MKNKKSAQATIFAFVLALALCGSASAATECVWVGGEAGLISTASNWSPATVPSGSSSAECVLPPG